MGHGVVADARTGKERVFYGYTIVGAASLIMVLVFTVHYAFGVFFKPVLTEFGWTRAMTSGAFSLVWISQGVVGILMGGLNDRFGPRLVLTVCGALVGAGFLLMSQITAVWQLYVAYGVLVGAGLGGVFVPLTSTTARWFVARRGVMTGIVTAGVGVGAFIGPPIANWLITVSDWRRSYMLEGAVVLIGTTIGAQFLKASPAQVGRRPYGESAATAEGAAAHAAGMSWLEALHTSQFWLASVAFLCYGFSLSAILLHLAPHATDLGMSATVAAAILATNGAASIVGKVVLGGLTDHIGNKNVYVVSFAMMVVALSWLIAASAPWALFAFAAVFGVAYGGLAAAHAPIVAWLFGMKRHGLIFGLCFNGWTLGCALGPLVAGYLFDVFHGYQLAFIVCTVVAAIGLLLTTLLTPVTAEPVVASPHALAPTMSVDAR
jgi:MFS family permease